MLYWKRTGTPLSFVLYVLISPSFLVKRSLSAEGSSNRESGTPICGYANKYLNADEIT